MRGPLFEVVLGTHKLVQDQLAALTGFGLARPVGAARHLRPNSFC